MKTNALDRSRSPYLRRHADNPVWWQEWSEPVLSAARDLAIPLFVSVGYATCHWCHVMAREAFSDPEIADILNREFISIKIDREERPDIDQYLMTFLIATQGSGGWPLNAFLTPDGRPFLALTYIPVSQRGQMPGFGSICAQVRSFLAEKGADIRRFTLAPGNAETPAYSVSGSEAIDDLVATIAESFDRQYGGFGDQMKFPPYTTLAFLLHATHIRRNDRAREMADVTLRHMAKGGLLDHPGGGFFRYCVDRTWSIPHFEKMLYDQAMALWVYSDAYATLGDPWYRQIAEGVYTCLTRDFTDEAGCLVSAHDAETGDREGLSYLWSDDDLSGIDPDWVHRFFDLGRASLFEGSRHLLRRSDGPLEEDDRRHLSRLHDLRRRRPQPARDEKIVTAWNALAATAMVTAARRLDREDMRDRATGLYRELERRNRRPDGSWCRSSVGGVRDNGRFLEDEAAILLLLTYVAEDVDDETRRQSLRDERIAAEARVGSFFRDGRWIAALMEDFPEIPSSRFDSPSPAPRSLAELALQRSALLDGRPSPPVFPGRPMEQDFYNLAWLIAAGDFFLVEGPRPIPWSGVPINVIQGHAPIQSWCFRGVCRPGLPETWNAS